MSKIARKVERPRPLKLSTNQNRHSLIENKFNTSEDIIGLIDAVSMNIMNGNYDQLSQMNIISLCKHLKTHGQQLENIFKDQLDRLFFVFRNAARDDRLDYMSRIYLLEVIELRAANWINSENINSYYKQNISIDLDLVSGLDNSVVAMSPTLLGPSASPTTVQPPVLAPGEVIKPSGKFSKPTKIPGKNYCKDEVVIRNSDSGKVMGIKGRRVHMIEELSETIISFQRVNPGAKERLVQITGPNEGKINDAKLLIEDTIRRNASPVRIESCEKEGIGGSSSSLNSSASDESNRYSHSGIRRSALHHSFSTNDANIGEYKYTVTIGNDTIKITGTNLEVVKTAKLVLDDYFSGIKEQYFHSRDFLTSYEDEEPTTPSTLPPVPAPSPVKLTTDSRVSSLDSGATSESEETYKAPPSDSVDNDKRESERSLDYSARNRKTSHSLVKDRSKVITKVEKEDTAEKPSPSKRITYSQSELVGFLASALSRGPPDDWDRICKNVSAITRKTPEIIDPVAYLQKWKESDGKTVIMEKDFSDPE